MRGLIPPDVYMCPGLSSEGKSGNATMYVCVPGGRAEEEDPGAMYDVPPPGPPKKESRTKDVCPHGPEDFFPAQSKFVGGVFSCFMLIFEAIFPTPCFGVHLQNVAGFPGRRTKKYEQHNITII